MMKKLIFAFAAAATMFIGGQAYTAHADTTNKTEHYQTNHEPDFKKQHPQDNVTKGANPDKNSHPAINSATAFVNLADPQSATASSSDSMIASLSPKMYLTSNKHFKVPESDTIDGASEMTDPSKGYAMNHYTGDNVNGDAQANDHVQPRQGQQN